MMLHTPTAGKNKKKGEVQKCQCFDTVHIKGLRLLDLILKMDD